MPKSYAYKTASGEHVQVELTDEVARIVDQANIDYQTSFTMIRAYYYDLWCEGLKMYYLSTADRATRIEKWQSNIPYGLVRGYIDAMAASITDKPFRFSAVGLNEEGAKNRTNVEHILNSISDITGLHKDIPKILSEGLAIGNICLRTDYRYKNAGKKYKAQTYVDDIPMDVEFDEEVTDVPYSIPVDMFNVFPDMYPSRAPRYVIERGVSTVSVMLKTFGALIESRDNRSPFKDKKYVNAILQNDGDKTVEDFGKIRMEIFRAENDAARLENTFNTKSKYLNEQIISDSYDELNYLTNDLIEWKYAVYNDRIVLLVNGFPLYVGVNRLGFIPYSFCILDPLPNMRLGLGVAYLLRGIEKKGTSILNALIDGQQAVANPTFIARRALMTDEDAIKADQPGGVIFVDDVSGNVSGAMARLDKGGVSDFGVLSTFQGNAQVVSGAGEYTLGVSARERTATGATAVAESSLRRLTPYLKRFANELGDVGLMWLKLIRRNWRKQQYVVVLDEDGNQTYEMLNNKNTLGVFSISLQTEGMLAASKEAEFTKMMEMYNLVAGSGIVNTSEFIKHMFRALGLNTNRLVVVDDATIPANKVNAVETAPEPVTSDVNRLQEIANPQPDFGNGGQGNPETVPPSEA